MVMYSKMRFSKNIILYREDLSLTLLISLSLTSNVVHSNENIYVVQRDTYGPSQGLLTLAFSVIVFKYYWNPMVYSY